MHDPFRGGWTAPRYAQVHGRQLGQLPTLPAELPPAPSWWPAPIPWPGPDAPIPPTPPGLPEGWLSVEECSQREKQAAQQAYAEGQRIESSKIIKTAAVSAAVSVMVGAAVGYMLR
jgi:hypothetical protein